MAGWRTPPERPPVPGWVLLLFSIGGEGEGARPGLGLTPERDPPRARRARPRPGRTPHRARHRREARRRGRRRARPRAPRAGGGPVSNAASDGHRVTIAGG